MLEDEKRDKELIIKTMKERLKDCKEKQERDIKIEAKIRTKSGKTYQGHITAVEEDYFCLEGYPETYVSIDGIESIVLVKTKPYLDREKVKNAVKEG